MCSSVKSLCCAPILRGDLPPQPRRFQHVGLIDRGNFLAPRRGELKRQLDDALHFVVVIFQRVDGACRGRRTTSRFFAPKYSPPVNSRTTMMSTPCNFSGFNGDASINAGCTFTGRRFANTCKPLRSASRPRSGRSLAVGSSHLGPPTAPSSTAFDCWHAFSVSSVNDDPCASIEQPPIRCVSYSNVWPNFCAITCSTRTASPTTSGPMPSPGRRTIFAFKVHSKILTRGQADRRTRETCSKVILSTLCHLCHLVMLVRIMPRPSTHTRSNPPAPANSPR